MTSRSNERGWVLVVAMIVMSLMLVVGLGTLKLVDGQASLGGQENARESSFNTAEGFLYAQSAVLQKAWPRTNLQRYPDDCLPGNYTLYPNQCPTPTELVGSGQIFNNVDDLKNAANWKVQVRDDVGATPANPNPIYDKATVDATTNGCKDASGANAVCTYDANGDRKLWVRAEATVNGKKRMLVALLQLENFKLPFAKNAVVGGSLNVSNQGNKTVVDATGSQVVVRCTPSPYTTTTGAVSAGGTSIPVASTSGFTGTQSISIDAGGTYEVVTTTGAKVGNNITIQSPGFKFNHLSGVQVSLAPGAAGNTCEGWDPNKQNAQVSPSSSYSAQSTYPNALTPGQLAAVEASADCTYSGTNSNAAPSGTCGSTTYGCPPSDVTGWSGKIVIKGPANCSIDTPGNAPINSSSVPGFVLVENGTLTVVNNTVFYGVIYMANQQNAANDPNNPVITVNGTAEVIGGIAVDGNGAVQLGQNLAVQFDANAFTAFSATGAAGLVQNTWRELLPTQ